MTEKKNNQHNKIKDLKMRITAITGLAIGSLIAGKNATAQEVKVKDTSSNRIEQTSYATQKNDHLYSNAEKLFDMYRLAYNNDTKFNMVSEKEKSKCQEFFKKYSDIAKKCAETDTYLNENRGLQGFNNAELAAIRQGDSTLRTDILEKLAKTPDALEEMNKININSEYEKETIKAASAEEQQAAHIWSMYVAVETGNASQAYKKFFDKYPKLYENCKTSADNAGITQEMLPVTTIADPDAELVLNNKDSGKTKSESLTQQLAKTINNYESQTGHRVKIPSSTYQVSSADFTR